MMAVVVALVNAPSLSYVFKPLATIFILTIALTSWLARKDVYSLWIAIGLFFSLAGDVLLLRSDQYFLYGLSAFLVTHIAYLIAFTRDAKFPARPAVWIGYFALAASLLLLLWTNLPPAMKIPVALYSAVLASMAGQAMGRFLALQTRAARLAAIGAILFAFSDTLLAFDRFHAVILLAPALILIPYYLGQLLIASSTKPKAVV